MAIVIAVKSIIDWVENGSIVKQERVLWIDHVESKAVLLDIRNNRAQPRWCNLEDVYAAIREGHAVKHPCDPFARNCTNDKHKEKGERRWLIIEEIVTCEPDVYFHNLRAAMVQDCLKKYEIKKSAVYKYIRLYWKGGKTKAALSLDYDNCGGPGRDKPDTAKKRGRPVGAKTGKRKSISDCRSKVNPGVNVTEEIKGVFEATFALFGKMKPSEMWQKMNETFFSEGKYWKDGAETSKLLPRDQRPTKKQLYYWLKKLIDPVKAKKRQVGDLTFQIKYREHKGNATQLVSTPERK
jgi:putative transposase